MRRWLGRLLWKVRKEGRRHLDLSSSDEGVQGAEGTTCVTADVSGGVTGGEGLWFWRFWKLKFVLMFFRFLRRKAGGKQSSLLFATAREKRHAAWIVFARQASLERQSLGSVYPATGLVRMNLACRMRRVVLARGRRKTYWSLVGARR